MPLKPTCPKCGSIKVKVGKTAGACLENDCHYTAMASKFKDQNGGARQTPNQHWRDPVAMSMDGYDE